MSFRIRNVGRPPGGERGAALGRHDRASDLWGCVTAGLSDGRTFRFRPRGAACGGSAPRAPAQLCRQCLHNLLSVPGDRVRARGLTLPPFSRDARAVRGVTPAVVAALGVLFAAGGCGGGGGGGKGGNGGGLTGLGGFGLVDGGGGGGADGGADVKLDPAPPLCGNGIAETGESC